MDVMISTGPGSTGWLLAVPLGLGFLCGAYYLYLLARHHRYRRPAGATVTVQGRLVGRAGALCFRAPAGPARAEEVLLVEDGGRSVPVIAGPEARGLRAGCFITADGVPVSLLREESLYRERASQTALLSGRLLVGNWPELRWLRVPVAALCLLCLLALACLFLSPSRVPGRLFSDSPVEDVVPASR